MVCWKIRAGFCRVSQIRSRHDSSRVPPSLPTLPSALGLSSPWLGFVSAKAHAAVRSVIVSDVWHSCQLQLQAAIEISRNQRPDPTLLRCRHLHRAHTRLRVAGSGIAGADSLRRCTIARASSHSLDVTSLVHRGSALCYIAGVCTAAPAAAQTRRWPHKPPRNARRRLRRRDFPRRACYAAGAVAAELCVVPGNRAN